jgi:hypothetical protein
MEGVSCFLARVSISRAALRFASFLAPGCDERHVKRCLGSRQAARSHGEDSLSAEESKDDLEAEMIKKLRNGYRVVSSKGKNLGGPYKTLEEAKKRLRQVEVFKRRGATATRVARRNG